MGDFLLGLVDPWLYVVLFLLAFAEGGALLGLFLPGESAMLLAGWLVSQGRASLGAVVAVAALGSVFGDSVGYWTGRRFGTHLRDTRLGRRIGDEGWLKAERFMRDKGKAAVAFGRFVSIFRTLVPPLAGSSRMGYRDFVVYNAPAAALWAAVFVMLGALPGDSWNAIAHWAGRAGTIFLAVVVIGIVAAVIVHRRRRTRHEKWVARESNPEPTD